MKKTIKVFDDKIIRVVNNDVKEYNFPFKEQRILYIPTIDREGFYTPELVIQLNGIGVKEDYIGDRFLGQLILNNKKIKEIFNEVLEEIKRDPVRMAGAPIRVTAILDDLATMTESAISEELGTLVYIITRESQKCIENYITNVLINNEKEKWELYIREFIKEKLKEEEHARLSYRSFLRKIEIKEGGIEEFVKLSKELIPTDMERLIKDLKNEGVEIKYYFFDVPGWMHDIYRWDRLELSRLNKTQYQVKKL
ncbi:MAG: hypothetical protein QXD48_00555 [Candidatus Aenigmatarchaeota archaeon]